jgi:hypothetical protein
MSLLVDQLAAYLQSRGEGTVGTDIFKFQRPSSPLAVLSIHPTGGYTPNPYSERERPTLMIFARAGAPNAALQKAYGAYNNLRNLQNVDLGGGVFALTIEAINSPAYVGTEQAANQTAHLASFNLLFDLRRPSS